VPYQTTEASRAIATDASAGGSAAVAAPATVAKAAGPVPEPLKRGLVVHVDTTRVVVDLTAADGLRPGTVLSLRRDRIPIVHPVTGEVLGELDDEVATVKVVELREKFAVTEIQTVAPGSEIRVRDRVLLK
jgi:hypothetical protein